MYNTLLPASISCTIQGVLVVNIRLSYTLICLIAVLLVPLYMIDKGQNYDRA